VFVVRRLVARPLARFLIR